jgi:hypothetical protein
LHLPGIKSVALLLKNIINYRMSIDQDVSRIIKARRSSFVAKYQNFVDTNEYNPSTVIIETIDEIFEEDAFQLYAKLGGVAYLHPRVFGIVAVLEKNIIALFVYLKKCNPNYDALHSFLQLKYPNASIWQANQI